MPQPILVAYATKRESTHEVADAVAARLRELGHAVDVRLAPRIGTLEPYRAVVLGGALYAGRWHSDARHFLAKHRDELTRIPIAVFALGPLKLEPKDVEGSRPSSTTPSPRSTSSSPFRHHLRRRDRPGEAALPFNRMDAADARDWDAIRSWADEIASGSRRVRPP